VQLEVFVALAPLLLAVLVVERYVTSRARARIPIVVHVNGTRGKSSVTRLIAAGLRAGGVRTWAKVTGTLPRLIDEDGQDVPIVRHSPASISEQRAVVVAASAAGVQALVVECMALKPVYQRVSEDGMLHASVGVITNIRPDHLEVFGSDPRSMVHGLAYTIPRGKIVFTAERSLHNLLLDQTRRRDAELVLSDPASVGDADMERFGYHEHKENVALALDVCTHLGVDPEVALEGMARCVPDVGALRPVDLVRGGRTLRFINAMAANDPQSTHQLYRDLVDSQPDDWQRLVIVNTRRDRPERTRQLAGLAARLDADQIFVIGDAADTLEQIAVTGGVSADRLSVATDRLVAELVGELLERAKSRAIVFAMGNIAGTGLELAAYFDAHGEPAATAVAPIRSMPELRKAA
jgi:poly-gamma-glutamate synthase PgsB/CapB